MNLTFHGDDFIVIHRRGRKAHLVQLRLSFDAYLHGFAAQHCGVVFVEGVEVRDLNILVHMAGSGLGGVDGWEGDIRVWHILL